MNHKNRRHEIRQFQHRLFQFCFSDKVYSDQTIIHDLLKMVMPRDLIFLILGYHQHQHVSEGKLKEKIHTPPLSHCLIRKDKIILRGNTKRKKILFIQDKDYSFDKVKYGRGGILVCENRENINFFFLNSWYRLGGYPLTFPLCERPSFPFSEIGDGMITDIKWYKDQFYFLVSETIYQVNHQGILQKKMRLMRSGREMLIAQDLIFLIHYDCFFIAVYNLDGKIQTGYRSHLIAPLTGCIPSNMLYINDTHQLIIAGKNIDLDQLILFALDIGDFLHPQTSWIWTKPLGLKKNRISDYGLSYANNMIFLFSRKEKCLYVFN